MAHDHDHDHDHDADDRHEHGDHGKGLGKSVTFDQFDTTTFVHTDIAADDSFATRFILRVDGFELNHSPVTLPGFGTHYGMYFLIDATGTAPAVGADTFTSMNVALMVDPHNNDGTLSASPDGIGFANGTADDFALLTGTLKTAGITFDGNVGHPSFFENVALTGVGEKAFGVELDPDAVLHEFLTTPGGPNNQNVPGGGVVQWINGTGHAGGAATASVTLDPQAPLSIRPALLNHDPHGGPFCG
ncbi:MAG TPA: hypothetical protein VL614_01475 [Acetobacteraceae bacterium]|nr:hypothetical protein [Acetobacteraceae bacterium]